MKEINPTTENNQVADSVRQFILGHFPPARRRPLGETDPLLESGIIDSLGVLDVVGFLESEFEVIVDDEDLVSENFQSIGQIASFIKRKQGSTT